MAKNNFSNLLNASLKKATAASGPKPEINPAIAEPDAPVVEPSEMSEPALIQAKKVETKDSIVPDQLKLSKQVVGKGRGVRNTNRVTVNLFEADSRALAVIRELLGSAGHDFTSRSDSMKIGLRLAAKAKPEELAKLFEQVKSEDRRYRSQES